MPTYRDDDGFDSIEDFGALDIDDYISRIELLEEVIEADLELEQDEDE